MQTIPTNECVLLLNSTGCSEPFQNSRQLKTLYPPQSLVGPVLLVTLKNRCDTDINTTKSQINTFILSLKGPSSNYPFTILMAATPHLFIGNNAIYLRDSKTSKPSSLYGFVAILMATTPTYLKPTGHKYK